MKRVFVLIILVAMLLPSLSFTESRSKIYSITNQPDLLELITLDLRKDSDRIRNIVRKYNNKTVELYLLTAFVEPYRNYKTRFNYLLYAVYDNQIMLSGSPFMLKDVSYYDLKLVGSNKPDVFDIGLFCRVIAEVDGMEGDSVLLDPVSIEVVSEDVATFETTKKAITQQDNPASAEDRSISGYNASTNQTLSWCGVDFSFPSYFNMLQKESESWFYYYPEQEGYYASLMFQSEDFAYTEEDFVSFLPSIIDATFNNNDDNPYAEILESREVKIAGLPGWTVKYIQEHEDKRNYSSGYYSIAYNPAVEKVMILSCLFDNIDESKLDYLGDYDKMIESAKLTNAPINTLTGNTRSNNSIYEYAFIKRGKEYSNYYVFDIDGKVVRYFTSNDMGVYVGSIKGDFTSEITIQFDYDGGWKETFKRKNGSQTEAILIDNDGFEWPFDQISVAEAEAILSQDGYHDVE